MKILFLTTDYPSPHEPGKGVFNYNLVRALAARHRVSVVSPIPWVRRWRPAAGPLAQPSRPDGVEVHYPTYYYPPKVLRHWYGWFYWKSVQGTVKTILAKGRPDAVVAYWAHPDGEAAVRAARLAATRSAVIVGGSDVLLLSRNHARRQCIASALSAADSVLVVSEHLRHKVVELGVPACRVHLWHQGVETQCFFPGDRTAARRALGLPADLPILVWVGRMVPVKGLDVLVRACAQLLPTGLPFHLYLVGDGPLRRSLQADVRRSRLEGRILFAGPCPHVRLADWYRAADLTVLPSRSEGLPNVLRESAACGTPFVASRVGGIPEIAEAGIDQLVPPDDAEALAAALARAISRPPPPRRFLPESWSMASERLIELLLASPAVQQRKPPVTVAQGASR